ncbi:MAG: hypothetical protein KGS61_06195 [Verrucomicrobia bacterium]|nr:hypothetical protein [Verrucomicrobiota bacterium]
MATNQPKPTADELLRSYAAKRRVQAGAPLELHPATRKLLQDEAARVFARPATEPRPTTRPLAGWWLRLAWGGAALAAVAGLLVIVSSSGRRAAQPLQVAQKAQSKTLDRPKRSRALAEDQQERLARKPVAVLSDRASQESTDTADSRDAIDRLAARGPAPTVGGGGGVEAAKQPGPYQAVEARQALVATAAPTPALVANQSEAGVAGNQAAFVAGNALTGTPPRRFVQIDSRARYRRNFNSPALPTVLTSFEVERGQDQIRIIDADGSIYEGRISNSQAGENVNRPAVKVPAQLGTELRKAAVLSAVQTSSTNPQASATPIGIENYSFRAVGTNRSSRQTVVFSGEFVTAPLSNGAGLGQNRMLVRASGVALPAAPAAAGGITQFQAAATNFSPAAPTLALPLPASQVSVGLIEGKVVVGGTNEFSLEAVPATR